MSFLTRQLAVKVPTVTAFFWIIKVLATTTGETFSDWINETLGFGLGNTTAVMTLVLVITLTLQVRSQIYRPWLYWLNIVVVSITGTLITDNLTDGMGFPLLYSMIIFGALLIVTFVVWFRREKSLAMKSINTRERELFYWLAILLTFAMGTATGDYLGDALSLGFGVSALIFAGAIALVALLWRTGTVGEILAFWIAYILTRPLGASIGDLLAQAPKDGGLGVGTTGTSIIFLAAILGCVTYLAVSKKDQIKA
ncbi:MAG: hypothetical protein RJA35_1395 [Actinomycetota bacterium]